MYESDNYPIGSVKHLVVRENGVGSFAMSNILSDFVSCRQLFVFSHGIDPCSSFGFIYCNICLTDFCIHNRLR